MNKNRFQILITVLSLFIFLLVVSVSAFLWISYQRTIVIASPSPQPSPLSAINLPTPTPDPLAAFGLLLLGYGGSGHDGGSLTDTIMLAWINPKIKNVHLISIPRDVWVTLPITDQSGEPLSEKINAVYAIGNDLNQYPYRPPEYSATGAGGQLVMKIVQDITGLPVKYFIALDFKGFEKAIDQLGGIDVALRTGFDDPFYPIAGKENDTCEHTEDDIAALTATLSGEKLDQMFPCRYEHLYFDAGQHHLDGEAALKFVRSRHSSQAGSDFARAERQQLVLQTIKQKVLSLRIIPKIIPLINQLSYHLHTNIDASTISQYSSELNDLNSFQIQTLVLSEQNVLQASRNNRGQYVLLPKSESSWQEVHTFLKTNIKDK